MTRQPAARREQPIDEGSLGEAVWRRCLSAISEQENRTVKKTVMAAGCFLALGVLFVVSQSWGQNQPQSSPPPAAAATPAKTRIAILNLTYVVKKYQKYTRFQEEIKGIIEPLQKKDAELRQALENLRKKDEELARQPQSPEREAIARQAKDIQRQLEDNSAEAKLKLGKRSDDEMKILFMDINEAAQRYAATHDIEMVLQYNDAVTEQDFFSPQNIARKMQSSALVPMYWLPSMDISMDVVNTLNYNMNQGAGAAAPAPAAGSPQR
jgi:Skp family chaperone for outer membrane proteins